MEKLGMRKLMLPLGVTEDKPYTVIFVSNDFETNKDKLAVLVVCLMMPLLNIRFHFQMNWGCGQAA